ncbi:MAG: Uma2 family endonuclease [Labilithrix sp.]|nr:Uma2 family endonuclease [Labilithrix sp.]MCW5809940.1 Uma2 family endonuclease [Labilithrix sp.]
MSPAAPKPKLTYAEYAAREASSETKHEFYDGEVYAMAGGTIEHGRMGTRVRRGIEASLPSSCGCVVDSPDIRVRTPSGKGTYPDGFVVCGKLERDSEDPDSVTNPTLIVEVLSEGTEGYDRGGKFEHYRSLSSLKEYVLVSYRKPLIESHLRNPDGSWTTTFAVVGERLALRSIEARLDVDDVYEGMTQVDGIMRLT